MVGAAWTAWEERRSVGVTPLVQRTQWFSETEPTCGS